MQRKAKAGHVTGGRVFGYDNVEVRTADGERSHVERRINDAEAAIVRRIFELTRRRATAEARSRSCSTTRALRRRGRNADGRTAGAPSSVREVLHRELYRGVIVWNQTRKRDRVGPDIGSTRATSAEWMRIEAPELRIVSEALWEAVHARLSRRARGLPGADTAATARRPPLAGTVSPYLLTGFVSCGCCGGAHVGQTRRHTAASRAAARRVAQLPRVAARARVGTAGSPDWRRSTPSCSTRSSRTCWRRDLDGAIARAVDRSRQGEADSERIARDVATRDRDDRTGVGAADVRRRDRRRRDPTVAGGTQDARGTQASADGTGGADRRVSSHERAHAGIVRQDCVSGSPTAAHSCGGMCRRRAPCSSRCSTGGSW